MTTHIETPKVQAADPVDDPIVLGLKQLYDSVLEEAVPDDFMALLGKIDAELAQRGEDTAPKGADDPENSTSGHSQ